MLFYDPNGAKPGHVKIKLATGIRLLIACVLGVVTLEVVAHRLPSGISDKLALPGGVAGMFGGLLGIYDIPSGPWAIACIIGNFLFYSALWWAALSVAKRWLASG